ncbi:serine/threonine protein kinase [bacterium]|nr:serine/threonine protein kinase [bacterium]
MIARGCLILMLTTMAQCQERFFCSLRTEPPGARVYQMDGEGQPYYLGSSAREQLELVANGSERLRLAFEYVSPIPFRESLDPWLGPASPKPSFDPASECVRGGWTVVTPPAKEMGPFALPLSRTERALNALYSARWGMALLVLAGLIWRVKRKDWVRLEVRREPVSARVNSRDESLVADGRGGYWVNRGLLGERLSLQLWASGYQARDLHIPADQLASLPRGGRLIWPPQGVISLEREDSTGQWELTLGEVVGGYQVLERLGEGVSAVVYRVRPLGDESGNEMALKLMKPGHVRGADLLPRFRREMEALARMRHPNIPMLYAFGEHARQPYLCMELLHGRSLSELPLPLSWAQARNILLQLARALEYAHQKGVLHRDVKPGNVVVATDGEVKLTDFGLSRSQEDHTVTAEGSLLGTPAYMAPEIISGQPATARSDQYSFACLSLEILTGQPVYGGESPMAVVMQHLQSEPPSVQGRLPGLDPEISALLQRMLSKAPEARLENLEILICALESNARASA